MKYRLELRRKQKHALYSTGFSPVTPTASVFRVCMRVRVMGRRV